MNVGNKQPTDSQTDRQTGKQIASKASAIEMQEEEERQIKRKGQTEK